MPFVKFHKPYKFAHDGIRVEEFTPGNEPVETTDECAAQAIQDGAAKAAKPPKADADKAAE